MKKELLSSSAPFWLSCSSATTAYLQPRSTPVYSIDWPCVCFTCHLDHTSTERGTNGERKRGKRRGRERKCVCVHERGCEKERE